MRRSQKWSEAVRQKQKEREAEQAIEQPKREETRKASMLETETLKVIQKQSLHVLYANFESNLARESP